MGATSRVSTLVIAVCMITGSAFAQPPPASSSAPPAAEPASAPASRSDISDRDRVWVNFTREAANVGHKQFWIELRGMKLMDDQQIKQPDSTGEPGATFEGPTLNLAGYALNDDNRCGGLAGESGCVTDIDGGRLDLVGAYGLLSTLEVGFDFPFVMQESVNFSNDADANEVGIGDLTLYGKFKRQLTEHVAGAAGLEINAPTGASSKGFGAGHTGLNPFLSARYQSGRVALGSHVGFLLNVDDPPDVFNWSLQGIVRGNALFSLRCEVNGRLFNSGGETYNDVAVWPGLDFNLTDYFIIRPQGLAHLSTDAINWGLGVGFVFTM